jgi:hypothetical protein
MSTVTPVEDTVAVSLQIVINGDEKTIRVVGTAINTEPLSLASSLVEAVTDQAQGWIGIYEKETER